MLKLFWNWYEKNKNFNVGLASVLFLLQLIHLYWLTTHVVAHKALGVSLWNPSPFLQFLLIIVDYTEIPALVAVSLIYLSDLRQSFNFKSVGFLILLNSQWLHLFWITDEFVINYFTSHNTAALPVWLIWLAISIDYFELPVIFDTTKKFLFILSAEK